MCAIWPVCVTQDESLSGRSPVPRPEADEFGDWQVDVTSGSRIDPPLLPIRRHGHPVPAPEGLCRLDLPGRDGLPGLSRGAEAWYFAPTAWFASITQLPAVLNVTGELPELDVTGLPDPPAGPPPHPTAAPA